MAIVRDLARLVGITDPHNTTSGLPGPQGVMGLKGDKGDTGAQGLQGPKGDTGAAGANGTNGTNGADGASGAAILHPGYVSQRYYGPNISGSTATTALANDTLIVIPIPVYYSVTIDQIAVRVGTQNAAVAKLGIYNNVGTGPGTLVAECNNDVDFNVAAGTNLAGTFTSNPTLTAGLYWFGICAGGAATVTPVTMPTAVVLHGGVTNLMGAASFSSFINTGLTTRVSRALTFVAGTAFLPASFGTATYSAAASPVLGFRVA